MTYDHTRTCEEIADRILAAPIVARQTKRPTREVRDWLEFQDMKAECRGLPLPSRRILQIAAEAHK